MSERRIWLQFAARATVATVTGLHRRCHAPITSAADDHRAPSGCTPRQASGAGRRGAGRSLPPRSAPAGTTQSRWPTRAVAALLARLALGPDRLHPREELVELLWPGVSLSVGRNRLRQALSALKALLETRDAAAAPVLMADHFAIRVAPGALACDVLDFERCLRSGRVEAARALYRGDLMPGHYDEWVLDERRRLAALRERLGSADPLLPHRALPQRASLHP